MSTADHANCVDRLEGPRLNAADSVDSAASAEHAEIAHRVVGGPR